MKSKFFTLYLCIISAALILFFFSGCSKNTQKHSKSDANTIEIVTTIFPEYDWVKEITGQETEHIQVSMLLDNGTDLHNYQPSAEDVLKILNCDLFICVGGESESWIDDVLGKSVNSNMRVLKLIDILGKDIKEEVFTEGMESDHEHHHGEESHDDHDHDDHDHGHEYDEHIWLSVKNAKLFCNVITDTIGEIDSPNKEIYLQNNRLYQKKLDELDKSFETAIKNAPNKTLLFADRFPFRYFVDDYNLSYYAAFSGCSAETEASFETVMFLADKVDELKLGYIFTIEKSDTKLANTIIRNTKDKNQKIMVLDSMQATTSKDSARGVSYISIMEKNLDVLNTALR